MLLAPLSQVSSLTTASAVVAATTAPSPLSLAASAVNMPIAGAAPITAASIVAADAIGAGLLYAVACFMGRSCFQAQPAESLEAIRPFWRSVKAKNTKRVLPRAAVKLIGVALLLVFCCFGSIPQKHQIDLIPSVPQMTLFSSWYASMGLADELDDLSETQKTAASRRCALLAKTFLILPIPLLMLWNASVYVPFAVYQLVAHSTSHKIDTVGLQLCAGLGVISAVLVSASKQVHFPVAGMVLLAAANALWQVHDEHPWLVRLNRRFPVFARYNLWDNVLSFHTAMVILVAVGALPLSWLSVQSPAYAAAKLGVADGFLQRNFPRKVVKSQYAGPSSVPFRAASCENIPDCFTSQP